jgi:hypothetical protein
MVWFFWNVSTEILKLYRCSKITVITSVIDLHVIQLKTIFQAKAHITYLATVYLSKTDTYYHAQEGSAALC